MAASRARSSRTSSRARAARGVAEPEGAGPRRSCHSPAVDPRYRALTERVDAFVARVADRHPGELRCRPGCDGCCRTRLTITAVEADAIASWAGSLPAEAQAAIAAAAQVPDEPAAPRCAALDAGGRCRIYPARPLVCRSHGVPIRLRVPPADAADALGAGRRAAGPDHPSSAPRGLPIVTACELNFTTAGPGAADPDCVLDQELLSTTLGLIDRAARAATATAALPDPRLDLAAVLAALDHEPDRR